MDHSTQKPAEIGAEAAGFAPGFRISWTDTAVLILGALGVVFTFGTAWWLATAIAFTVGHFFLFCNVFRVDRPLELLWSAAFVALVVLTLLTGQPGWLVAFGVTLLASLLTIGTQLRKPTYHGILWRRINPGLREHWAKTVGVGGR